jgi:hypothetical protein
MTHDPPENTVKPGFEIEPIEVAPEPHPHDPMDAHWQALIAERDELLKETAKLNDMLVSSAEYNMRERHVLRAERDKLKEEVERLNELIAHMNLDEEKLVERVSELEHAADSVCQWNWSDNDPEPVADMDRLRTALEKIKFRNHPGTTNHELAKEALNHD